MKSIYWFLLCILLSWTACNRTADYEPSAHLTEAEQLAFKQSISRYIAPLPKKANHHNRFESAYDPHYMKQAGLFRLDKYYPSSDGYVYFEVSRIAPSFKVKRAATAGKLRYNEKGEITEYEEVYRTWKMEEEELAKKTAVLFSGFLNNEDLTPFLTANSTEEYIEFPDHQVRYNKAQRRWEGNDLVLQARP